MRIRLAGALLASCCAGCTDPTQLVVWLDSDLPASRMDHVAVEVAGPDGVVYQDTLVADLPASFGVRPKNGDARRLVTVTATGLHDGDTALTTAAATTFVEHENLRLDLFLSHLCLGVDCDPGFTCRAGDCERIRLDPRGLPGWDHPPDAVDAAVLADAAASNDAAAPADASVDAAAPDASALDAGADAGTDGGPCVGCDALVAGSCGADETCRFYSADCSRCETPGPVSEGGACDSESDCGSELGCLSYEGSGVCQPYCASSADCGSGTDVCSSFGPLGLCTGGCDPMSPGDCPGDTQCAILAARLQEGGVAWAGVCVPVGAQPVDASCTAVECERGMQCNLPSGEASGSCQPPCRSSNDCEGATCVAFDELAGQVGAPPDVGLCTAFCDPVLDGDCPAAESCRVLSLLDFGTGLPATVVLCLAPGTAALGEGCDAEQCAPGGVCVLGLCRQTCEVDMAGSCTNNNESCGRFPQPLLIGAREFGFCI